MDTKNLIYAIEVLTKLVQPKPNNVTFATQNKAQELLSDLVDELYLRQ